MAFLQNQILRKFILSAILLWGTVTFYLSNGQNQLFVILIVFVSIFGLFAVWKEFSAIFTLILLSFFSAYAFYTFFLQFDLPLWALMISILVVFSYLFTYTEQKIGILSNKRLIYLVLFSLVILQVFLILSYFLINPISQSLVIAAVSYLFIGFCYTILAKHESHSFVTYLIVASIMILLVFASSSWGSLA